MSSEKEELIKQIELIKEYENNKAFMSREERKAYEIKMSHNQVKYKDMARKTKAPSRFLRLLRAFY